MTTQVSVDSTDRAFVVCDTRTTGRGLFLGPNTEITGPGRILFSAAPKLISCDKDDVDPVRHNGQMTLSLVDRIVNEPHNFDPRDFVRMLKEDGYTVSDTLRNREWKAATSSALANIAKGPAGNRRPKKEKRKKKDMRELYNFVYTYNRVCASQTATLSLAGGGTKQVVSERRRGFRWVYDVINHSCAPNAVCVPPHDPVELDEPMVLVSKRAIKPGEEVTIDYLGNGDPDEEGENDTDIKRMQLRMYFGFECKCATCRGEGGAADEAAEEAVSADAADEGDRENDESDTDHDVL